MHEYVTSTDERPLSEHDRTQQDSHSIPVGDWREHRLSDVCWCGPAFDIESGLWVHYSLDQRELYEDGTLQIH